MSNLTKGLILVVAILLVGAGLVVWKNKVGGHTSDSYNSISKAELEMLLADVSKSNPAILNLIRQLKFSDELRGDDIFALARKTSAPLERYPGFLYVGVPVEAAPQLKNIKPKEPKK